MGNVVKCRICGIECNGEEALVHKEGTGHNTWELILPKKESKRRGLDNHKPTGIRLDGSMEWRSLQVLSSPDQVVGG